MRTCCIIIQVARHDAWALGQDEALRYSSTQAVRVRGTSYMSSIQVKAVWTGGGRTGQDTVQGVVEGCARWQKRECWRRAM